MNYSVFMKRILLISLFLFFFLQIFAQNSDVVFQEKGIIFDFNIGFNVSFLHRKTVSD